jgi:hypothetical protein
MMFSHLIHVNGSMQVRNFKHYAAAYVDKPS